MRPNPLIPMRVTMHGPLLPEDLAQGFPRERLHYNRTRAFHKLSDPYSTWQPSSHRGRLLQPAVAYLYSVEIAQIASNCERNDHSTPAAPTSSLKVHSSLLRWFLAMVPTYTESSIRNVICVGYSL